MTRFLLADPDPVSARGVQLALERRGLLVETVCDGHLALARIQLGAADVCAVDAGLRGMDALTLLRRARASGVVIPLVVVAAHATPAARVTWFDAGADDLVAKPFDPDELAVRLKAVHRRGAQVAPVNLSCGPLTFDVLSGSFLLRGALLELTPREHAFVKVLISRPGFLVPKDRLFRAVFASEAGSGAIDVLACRVRRKLGGSGVVLTTVRGMDYLLEQDRSLSEQAPA